MEKNSPEIRLPRELGLFPVTNIVVANMIGAGIFTTSGLLMGILGNPAIMVLLWIAGGIISFCGALIYGELGAAYPRAGGEYVFLSEIFHPLAGFLSGWMSFIVGFSAPIAASAMGFSEYFLRAFPGITEPGNGFPTTAFIGKGLAVFVILLFSLIHTRGIWFGAIVQNFLTILKICLIAGLVFAGFSFGNGEIGHISSGKEFNFDFGGWKAIGLSLMWIMFAYSGWNASTYIGSEIKNPHWTIPRSLLLGTGIVTLLYLSLNLFFIYAVSPDEMKGVVSISGLAVGKAFGNTTGSVLSLLISFALFSSLSAFIILGPRVYYAMARDGYFFKFVGRVNPVHKVPAMAVLLQSAIAIILTISGTFDQILTYMGFSLGIFPILTVLAGIMLRRKGKANVKLPGYPVTHLIYILSGTGILVLAYFERPLESTIAVVTLITGIPAFYLFRKTNRRGLTD